MHRLPRIFMVALLVVFATSVTAHAIATTSMSIEMAMSGSITGDVGGCDRCGLDDTGNEKSGSVCKIVCITSFVSAVSMENTPLFLSRGTMMAEYIRDLAGRVVPPEPSPPRTLTLS
ncbi:MAG: hypothetical protein RIC93_06555 [Alphaproteobacteria bacterium]